MNRSKIIQHYKSFFDIEDMGLAENDNLMIDWAEDLVKNCIKPPVIKSVCPKCASEDVIWTCYCNCCHECM
jgi:hypothetical protein